MNIADSSAWIDYFRDGKNSDIFDKIINNKKKLLVPTIIIYEVFKKFLTVEGEETATYIAAQMKNGKIIDIDLAISLLAAQISVNKKLPMADSLIYACAHKHNATLWTQDADFKGLPGVKYFPKS